MSLKKTGFRRVQRMLTDLPEVTEKHLKEANRDNALDVVRVAWVLVPVGATARSRAAITTRPEGNGQLMDFGPLSSILEGGTEERHHKSGKSVGKGPKRPFVNPALQATEDRRAKRNRKALSDAVKEAKSRGD